MHLTGCWQLHNNGKTLVNSYIKHLFSELPEDFKKVQQSHNFD